MEKADVISKLQEVFDRVFKENSQSIREELTAKDVAGWDSFTHLTLIQEVENSFDIEFKMKELMRMDQVGDMIRIIESKFT
ncbi:MAG: acyl carrier protein [Crocinitomicaceae bacterium]|jgi:acyl carrier protein